MVPAGIATEYIAPALSFSGAKTFLLPRKQLSVYVPSQAVHSATPGTAARMMGELKPTRQLWPQHFGLSDGSGGGYWKAEEFCLY